MYLPGFETSVPEDTGLVEHAMCVRTSRPNPQAWPDLRQKINWRISTGTFFWAWEAVQRFVPDAIAGLGEHSRPANKCTSTVWVTGPSSVCLIFANCSFH
jgi:hypothetical protein